MIGCLKGTTIYGQTLLGIKQPPQPLDVDDFRSHQAETKTWLPPKKGVLRQTAGQAQTIGIPALEEQVRLVIGNCDRSPSGNDCTKLCTTAPHTMSVWMYARTNPVKRTDLPYSLQFVSHSTFRLASHVSNLMARRNQVAYNDRGCKTFRSEVEAGPWCHGGQSLDFHLVLVVSSLCQEGFS